MFKVQIYARLGVQEVFLYDPTADYLDPPLRGFRLERGEYTRIDPDATGALSCRQLDLTLRLEEGDLVLDDSTSGQRLCSQAEAADAAREAAEQRAAKLEAELLRLRQELSRKSRDA